MRGDNFYDSVDTEFIIERYVKTLEKISDLEWELDSESSALDQMKEVLNKRGVTLPDPDTQENTSSYTPTLDM